MATAGTITAAVIEVYGSPETLFYCVSPTNYIFLLDSGQPLAPGGVWIGADRQFTYVASTPSSIVVATFTGSKLVSATTVLKDAAPTTAPSSNTASVTISSTSVLVSSTTNSSTASLLSLSSSTILSPLTTSVGLKPTSSTTPQNLGVSKGGAAGIGIGCAIAGAAIAFLLFWFFKRKSNNRHQTLDQETRSAALSGREKQPVVNIQPLDNANLTTRTVENNLPQPLEDNAIAEAISKISISIKNHVQSYYHSARVSVGTVNPDALQALGDGFPTSIGALNTMLANPTTRETALRLCIAWVVVSRIQFGGDPRITFLPPEVISCINSMTGLDSKPQVRTAFLSKWRILTAELMQTTYGGNAFSANDPRNHNILQAVEVLDAVLRPYTDERVDNNQRRRNLEEILKRAAGFAFMLFSQPSSWKLEWENPHGHEPGSIVIFPALVQIVDETGRSLSPPRAFSEVVVRQIDG